MCARPPVRPSSARHSLRVRPGSFFARFEAPARPNVAHCAGQNIFSLLSASEFPTRRRPSGALARRRRRIRLAPTFFPPAASAAVASFNDPFGVLASSVAYLQRARCRLATTRARGRAPWPFAERVLQIKRQRGMISSVAVTKVARFLSPRIQQFSLVPLRNN